MVCPSLAYCQFFNDKMPMAHGLGSIYKKKYCLENSENCARFMIIQQLGPEHVPDNLYPGMLDIAGDIIDKAKHSNGSNGID